MMSKRKTRLTLSALLAIVLITGVVVMPVAAAGNLSATGGGTTEELGLKSTFVFNAVQTGNGAVTGHLVYQFRGGDIRIRMALDCLNVAGNVATMSGVVTQVSEEIPGFIFVGQDAVFQVEDNGQGAGANPDLFSDLWLYTGASCNSAGDPNLVPAPYLPVSGNIQVR